MTVLGWVLFGLAAWVVLAVLAAMVVGPVLRRNAELYPVPEDGPS